MANIGDILFGTDVEPSPFQITMEQIFLSGLQKSVQETNDLSSAVDATLGLKRDASGALVSMTDEERFENLDPVQRQTFDLVKKQAERVEKAFAGTLPVSERLKQRSEDQFKILKEEQGRRGNAISGTNLDTAVGFSTPAIQSIGERQRTQGLLEDEERRGEISSGLNNVFSGTGILSDLNQRNFGNLTAAPSRFGIASGSGLLANNANQSLFNAQRDPTGGIGGLLGDVTKSFAAEAFKKLFK